VTTSAGNAPGKSSYANITSKPSRKKVNVCTLFTPRGNGIDVVVSMDSIRIISERFANTAYGFFLGKKVAYPVVANYVRNTWGKYGIIRSMFSSSTGLFSFQFSSMDGLDAMLENGPCFVKLHGVLVTAFNEDGLSAISTKMGTPLMLDFYTSDMCMQSRGRSSYARVMIELRADVELKHNIVVAMPKITRVGHYTCNVHVEYEWKPPRCLSCKVFGHIHEECLKNAGAEYRPVPKKSTTSSSGNKKKGVEPTIEVSNSNPFDVLNSFDNDVKFGTNRRTTNLVNNGATSSGSSFMNVDNSSSGTTPIIDKIRKFEDLLTSGQAILVDKAGNPLKKVEFSSEYDSEDEVASVDNYMARSMASKRVGFGTQRLLEQWRDSYGNGDYDDDPYDDDMYEGQEVASFMFLLSSHFVYLPFRK
ncbi:retrotransposon protein, putative, ty1-copia subclass, partial [Tanacetum coccineum]